jgi:hypothetical protein
MLRRSMSTLVRCRMRRAPLGSPSSKCCRLCNIYVPVEPTWAYRAANWLIYRKSSILHNYNQCVLLASQPCRAATPAFSRVRGCHAFLAADRCNLSEISCSEASVDLERYARPRSLEMGASATHSVSQSERGYAAHREGSTFNDLFDNNQPGRGGSDRSASSRHCRGHYYSDVARVLDVLDLHRNGNVVSL